MAEHSDNKKKEPDYDAMSFGRYLKALREEKSVTIESVAKETRVNLNMLQLIELEDHDRLPDEVFVKGFIRSYATLIGANPDELVQRYLANHHLHRQNARFKANQLRVGHGFWPRLILSLVTLACLIVVSVLLLLPPETRNTMEYREEPAATAAPPLENPPTMTPPKTEKSEEFSSAHTHSLAVAAVKETWVKIIIDEQTPKTYSLNPGDHLELTAKKRFNLLIGNGAAITLKLNEKPIPVPGNQGNMVTLRLP
ncbi:MAG: helix-turn-helix domain-containing protein [Pseudomonadota bacterium]